MDELQVLKWIDDNLGAIIEQSCAGTMYDKALLIGLTCKETGNIISRVAPHKLAKNITASLMMGDYTKRKHDANIMYHGYGYTQIDRDSFPQFIFDGSWKIPEKLYPFTIKILEGKRHYIINHFNDLTHEELLKGIVSAYNCGEGNVVKAIQNNEDTDIYTTGHNYAADVLRLANLFKTKIEEDESI